MNEPQLKLSFSGWWWSALALALPPALVLGASSLLLSEFGRPLEPLARPLDLNGHAEAAARVTVLASSLGLAAIGLACILYFGSHLRLFRGWALAALAGLALAAGGIGTVFVANDFPEEAQRLLGEDMVKVSLRALNPQCRVRGNDPLARFGPAQVHRKCTDSRYEELRKINRFQRLLLSFVTAALIFGTIACLAAPAIPTSSGTKAQMDRLNTYLYLSAAAMVAGLLFLSALLRWPGYSVHKDVIESFNRHAGALVLYWGVTYSAFIAAYYIPVAIGLSCRWRSVTGREVEEGSILPPLGLLKAGAAIFSPTIAALIGAVIAT